MVGLPRKRPRDKFGTGQPGRLDRIMWKRKFKGQNVHGTDRTYDGTDGTCPWDRRNTHQGVSRQSSLCLLFFFWSFSLTAGHPKAGRSDFRNRYGENVENAESPSHPPQKKGSEEIPQSNAENADTKTRKMRVTGFNVTGFR